ncbi:DUF4259 domain-containing protein [Erythrobacter oryzae]|uniref:DUF4259 domain-containing protein n=1 Tax=Erythrobacter oryzae TaxID=3019556 RepID=UPI002554B427|nr:DUF4259 domain-containing protein [Erythrobacter sp. COR-2]
MGTWGIRPFDNDDASDLFYELKEEGADHLAILRAAVTALDPDYVEADQGQRAVAAAALVLFHAGGPATHLSEYELPFASANPVPGAASLLAPALAALDRVLAGSEQSELHALWAEQPGGLEDWGAVTRALRADLAAAQG